MERLIVKNFGPLKSVDIEIKNINVFIGPTGSGKSTLAKLLAILTNSSFNLSTGVSNFNTYLQNYKLLSCLDKSTYIKYTLNSTEWVYSENNIESNYLLSGVNMGSLNIYDLKNISYIRINRTLTQLKKINLEQVENKQIAIKIKSIIKELKKYSSENSAESIIRIDSLSIYEDLLFTIDYLRTFSLRTYPIYVPAERVFYSTFQNAIASFYNREITVPFFISEFAEYLEMAQFNEPELNIEEIGLSFITKNDRIYHKAGQKSYSIDESASGIQSLMPLTYAVANFKKLIETHLFVEEPELNLFPKAQYGLVKFLVRDWPKDKRLIITTHSPYILSSLDNLITAGRIGEMSPTKTGKVVSKNYWLDYDNVNAYYFNPEPKRGKHNTENIMNPERKGIAGNVIDEVSDILNIEYERLQEIESNG